MANLRVDKITSTETFETTGSVQFDGTTGELTVSGSDSATTYDFGTDDFTIEFWRYKSSSAVESYVARLDSAGGSATSDFWFGNVNGVDGFYYYEGSTGRNLSTESQPLNTWAHLAAVRHNDYLTLYLNGKEVASRSHSAAFNNGSADLRIGGDNASSDNTNYPLEGFLSNVRITKKALYTSNFKPAMRELEVLPETILLACQSKTDASLEKTGKTLVVGGTPVASEITPGLLTPVVKSGGGSAITGSVEFDGNDDYLTPPGSTDFTLGTGDFTIECWVYPKRYGGIFQFFDSSILDDSTSGPSIGIDVNDDSWAIRYGASSTLDTTTIAKLGEWYHVAYVRNSSVTKLYLNGQEIGSVSDSTDYSANYPVIGGWYNSDYYHKGFISNFRVVKGTALYTDDFIPPTKELKRVPGTVLLCCQDPNNPLTEATGKTITPHGSLGDGSLGGELVTNNSVWTLTKGGSGAADWTVSNNGSSLAGTTVTSGFMRATYTLDEGDYLVSLRWTGGTFAVQDSTGYITTTDGTDTDFAADEDGAYSFYMSNTTSVVITATAWNTSYTVDDISIKRIYKNNGASNFTPQVGDDRKVTFEGVTKINSNAYFYLPTGNTESRTLNVASQASSSARGLFAGGYSYGNPAGSRPTSDVIDYITISSTGDALDFGDLTESRGPSGGVASPTRGVWIDGDKTASPYRTDTIDYVTISSKGNAQDFGNTTGSHGHGSGNVSDSTRGICGGGNPGPQNNIEYITIASTGNGQDFGDLTVARYGIAAVSSPTRGVFSAGDKGPAMTNTMDYITIQSMGNALDFGDGIRDTSGIGGASNSIRGLFANGYTSPFQKIDYITIASTGNAIEFGDMNTGNSRFKTGTSSPTRAVFAGGYGPSPAYSGRNDIEYVTIMSLGTAVDFGNLTSGRGMAGGCSNGHGGLG